VFACLCGRVFVCRQGSTLLSRIDGPYSDAMAIVEHMRKEAAAKEVGGGGGGAEAEMGEGVERGRERGKGEGWRG